MRIVARLKLGYYPLPVEQGPMLRARLAFPEAPTSALDPCCGTGAALHALTGGSNTTLYGVELDANRAVSAKSKRHPDHPGQRLRRACPGRTVFLPLPQPAL